MADQTIRFPKGIARDVMVKTQDHFVPADFMVLDMGDEEEDIPIILGRPFLNTTNAIIYISSGQIHFQFPDEKVCCHFNSYTNHEQPKKPHNNRRRLSRRQANQPLKDGWANYPREVSRYDDCYGDQDDKVEKNETETVKEPRWNEWDKDADEIELPTKEEAELLKSKTQITMIWKEKKKATSPTQKEQTSEPLAGSDDTPDK
jgi:hypothetical protein